MRREGGGRRRGGVEAQAEAEAQDKVAVAEASVSIYLLQIVDSRSNMINY
jgi:hypothetical protein